MGKKVYILAFQRAFNYGALLQIYALKKTISRMGFEVHIIDYVPQWMKITLKNQPNILSYFKRLLMKIFFNPFLKKLGINKPILSIQEAEKKLDGNGMFIVGSDQVWNEKLIRKDPMYFFSFLPNSTKRIGYAVSMGNYPFSIDFLEKIEPEINKFHSISAREKFVADYLKENNKYSNNIPIVLDPTLLLKKEDYDEVSSTNTINKPFIAVYPCMYDQNFFDLVSYIKLKTGLPLVNLGYHFKGSDKNDYIFGPENWLNKIRNAKYFITNSFHGTAFAILHKTQFLTVPTLKQEEIGLNARFTELLDSLDLSDRLVTNPKDIDAKLDSNIDFDNAFLKLETRRSESLLFLRNALADQEI